MSVRLRVYRGDEESREAEVSSISLLFIDTFRAELADIVGDFDSFEYEDEDGDKIVVRSDEDLEVFASGFLPSTTQAVPIWIAARRVSADLCDVELILPEELTMLEPLSRGHMGTVYKSLHVPSDTLMAVKCVQLLEDGDRHALLTELHILAKCRGDFVVHLLGTSIDGNQLSICMELMCGGSCADYPAFPPPVMRPLAKSVCAGLEWLWQNGVMHRDLKPSNILLNTSGYVKLADFGVSKLMDESVARSYVGTGVYMAPERASGGGYKLESDVWSLGVCLLELMLGEFPWRREDWRDDATLMDVPRDVVDVLGEVVGGEVRVEGELVERHGPDARRLLHACIQKDASRRWGRVELAQCAYIRDALIDREAIAAFVREKRVR